MFVHWFIGSFGISLINHSGTQLPCETKGKDGVADDSHLVVVETRGTVILVGVVLVGAGVVVVVQSRGVLLGVTLGLDPVVLVHALGLGQTVDFTPDEAGEELLGELVRDGFPWIRVSMVLDDRWFMLYPPSLRWWSSKALKASKLAAPAIAS
jgi:hypothetical protein